MSEYGDLYKRARALADQGSSEELTRLKEKLLDSDLRIVERAERAANEALSRSSESRTPSSLVAMEKAYLFLLGMPHDGVRARSQEALVALRDCIARESRLSVEQVQNEFEALASQSEFDSLAQSESGATAPDTFWVIEQINDIGNGIGYWDGGSSRSFVQDIEKAIQFRRHQDAFWATRGWHWKDTAIREHTMLPATRQPRSGVASTQQQGYGPDESENRDSPDCSPSPPAPLAQSASGEADKIGMWNAAIEQAAAICDVKADEQSKMADGEMERYRKARAWDASFLASCIRQLKRTV